MNSALDQNINTFHKGFTTTEQGKYEDPTYLGFKLVFDFNPAHRNFETGQTDDPLFSEDTSLESAMQYLKATGYKNRAEMLKKFKDTLQFVNETTPWYFQTLSGVNDLWKIEFGENFNPFRGKDKVLEITCLESIDLRMTALADMYRKATFDAKFMRHLLPENLRWFTVRVQIAEIRKFHKLKATADGLNVGGGALAGATGAVGAAVSGAANKATSAASSAVGGVIPGLAGATKDKISTHADDFELIDDLISLIEFHCSHCTFDFSESFPSEKELSMNGATDMATQKFKIKVGHIEEHHRYKIMDVTLKDGVTQENGPFSVPIPAFDKAFNKAADNILSNTVQGFTNGLQDKLKELTNIPGNLIAGAVNSLSSKLTSAQLGNVYDLRNQTLVTAINGFLGKNEQLGVQPLGKEDVYSGVPGVDTTSKISDTLGNIYR